MKKSIISFGTAFCVLLASCKKTSTEFPSIVVEPVRTEKGTPIGVPVSKQIDANGGELLSGDGKVKINIPAGAVSAVTEFAIQPISSIIDPTHPGKNAYRLLPEGKNFSKPVEITFQYEAEDWNGSNEDLLTVIYQKQDGSWQQVPASLNKNSKTITMTTTHFSDWQVSAAFQIMGETIYGPGQSGNLKIFGIYEQEELLAPLNSSGWEGYITSAGNWRILSGPGSLDPVSDEAGAVLFQRKYTAPASVSTIQKVEVAVTVRGRISIPDPMTTTGKRLFSDVTLIKELTILPGNFMTGSFGTREISFSDVLYTSGQGFAITGKGGSEEIIISIDASPGTGTFPAGSFITEDGNSKTIFSFPGGPFGTMAYFSEYASCDPADPIHYSGQVKIEAFGNIGQLVKGSFQGTLYRMLPGGGDCPQYEPIPLNIQFTTTRTM